MVPPSCDVCGHPLPDDADYAQKRHAGECHREHERRRLRALRAARGQVVERRSCALCAAPFDVKATSIATRCPACRRKRSPRDT